MPLLGSCGQLCTMAAPGGQLNQLWDLHMRVSGVSKVEQAAETELFQRQCQATLPLERSWSIIHAFATAEVTWFTS